MARLDMGGMGSWIEVATMAERQPTPETLFELGIAYSAGREVDADLVAAHMWFNIAAVRGMSEAASYRQEVAREMSAAAIAEAQRAARQWLSKH